MWLLIVFVLNANGDHTNLNIHEFRKQTSCEAVKRELDATINSSHYKTRALSSKCLFVNES